MPRTRQHPPIAEVRRARQLATEPSGYVRVVLVVPKPAKRKRWYRAYFADSNGKTDFVTVSLRQLEKPSDFKKAVRSQCNSLVRHWTEHLKSGITPAWREEIVAAIREGDRLQNEKQA